MTKVFVEVQPPTSCTLENTDEDDSQRPVIHDQSTSPTLTHCRYQNDPDDHQCRLRSLQCRTEQTEKNAPIDEEAGGQGRHDRCHGNAMSSFVNLGCDKNDEIMESIC